MTSVAPASSVLPASPDQQHAHIATSGTRPPPPPPPGFRLVPINLEDPEERQILYDQRIICGWNSDYIERWRAHIADDSQSLHWLTVPAGTPAPRPHKMWGFMQTPEQAHVGPRPLLPARDGEPSASLLPVGHISVDRSDHPDAGMQPDPDMTRPDGSRLKVSSLFVLPEYGGAGLGAAGMLAAEDVARRMAPACRELVITTLGEKYWEEEGRDGRGIWERLGVAGPPQQPPLRRWYESLGYVFMKHGLRRHEPGVQEGDVIHMYDTYLIKTLEPAEGS